jgi:predicted ester cyclase
VDVVDELIAPDYVNHNGLHDIRGRDGIKRAIAGQLKAFPNLHTTIEDIIAEDDKVVIRAVGHFAAQPNNQPVAFPWIEILRLEDGKLVEAWSEPEVEAAVTPME